MSEDAHRATLARLLLDVQRQPGMHALAMRQPAALFDAMPQVLQWAAGRQLGVMAGTLTSTEADLQHAAMWLVRQTCLRTGADALTVLGLAPGFTRASLREHYRLLIRLTHPDFMAAHQGEAPWPDDAAQRINTANDTLLRRLGDADVDPGEPEPAAPPPPVTPAAPACVPPPPPPGGYPRTRPAPAGDSWSWDSISPRTKMAGAATGALLCVLALLWSNGSSSGSRLVARPPAPSSPPPGAALPAPAPVVVADAAPMAPAEAPAQDVPAPQIASTLAKAPPPPTLSLASAPAERPAEKSTDKPAEKLAETPPEPAPRWWETVVALPASPPPQPTSPSPTTVAVAQPSTDSAPASPPAEPSPPPLPPTRLGLADVQGVMTNLVGHLGHGRVNEAVAMLAPGQGNGGEFSRRYREWLGSHRVQGPGVVTMEARPRNGQLWVDSTVELRVTTAEGQADRRFLPFRAAFEGEPAQAVLVGVSLRPAVP